MPFTPHEQYDVSTPAALWFRNLRNYAGRMAPVPIALLVLALLARLSPTSARGTLRQQLPLFAFALAWIAVFIAPVLPIAARSELYLYAPVFGACLAAGAIAASQWPRRTTTLWRVAVGILVVALAGYQMSRSLALHRDLQFSSRFVSALAGQPALRTWAGAVAVVPRDAVTERALRDAVGGYLPTVLRQLFPDPRLTGVVAYDGRPLPPNAVRLSCELRDGDVKLTSTPPHAARGSRDATK